MRRWLAAALACSVVAMSGPLESDAAPKGAPPGAAPGAPELPDAAQLERLARRLHPVDLAVDIHSLPAPEQKALAHIVAAARLMDPLFLRQSWPGNPDLLLRLAADRSALGKARLHAFLQNKGPWLRLDDERAFLPGLPAKPGGGDFYPADASKAELERWHATLTPAARAEATGFFTAIRRLPSGGLTAVPYSVEYQGELAMAARHLRAAAAATQQPTLRAFLEARAAAFASNDYRESDVLWMKLDASIEPTIGPYEVYEDEWFNAKAAFEAFVTIREDGETKRLATLSAHLQDIEDHLPIAPALRNPKLGALSPIRVVSSLFASGDANRGVQTAAFNLPNDEVVTAAYGAKRTMLKNVQEAKFRVVLQPIAKVALAAADRAHVTFDAFFTHILMHELMHGLGPHKVQGQSARTVREALQQSYSAIEEAKADIAGLFALQRLVDQGVLDRSLEATMYTTFLASAFRSIRFGLREAHGRGIALQLNTLLDAGAVKVAAGGTFAVVPAAIKTAVTELTGRLMTLQAAGDRAGAEALLARMAVLRPEVKRVLDKLGDVPVDIEPHYVTAEALPPATLE